MRSSTKLPSQGETNLLSELPEPIKKQTYRLLSSSDTLFFPQHKKPLPRKLTHHNIINPRDQDDSLLLQCQAKSADKKKFVAIGSQQLGIGGYSGVFPVEATLLLDTKSYSIRIKTKNQKAVKIQTHDASDSFTLDAAMESACTQAAAPYLRMQAPILYVYSQSVTFSFLIMQRLEGKDLFDSLDHRYLSTPDGKLNTALHITEHVIDMHKMNAINPVLHGDIKSENFLLHIEDEENHKIDVHLIDFGFARFTSNFLCDQFFGSPDSMDHAFLASRNYLTTKLSYTKQNDDYSTGLTLHFLLADHDVYLEEDITKLPVTALEKLLESLNTRKYDELTLDKLNLDNHDTSTLLGSLRQLIHPVLEKRITLEEFAEITKHIMMRNIRYAGSDTETKSPKDLSDDGAQRQQKVERLTHILPRFFEEKRKSQVTSFSGTQDKLHKYSGYGL